jgi:homoserine dehydrogenase
METVGIGLLGLGTVGGAVARRLMEQWELLG